MSHNNIDIQIDAKVFPATANTNALIQSDALTCNFDAANIHTDALRCHIIQ